MKICLISPKSYPVLNPNIKSIFGGAEIQIINISKELSTNKNIDVHLLVADYKQNKIETWNSLTVWKSIKFDKNIVYNIYIFLKIFLKIDADVYIQRTLTPYSWLIALLCKFLNKKFIYMVAHDSESDLTHKMLKKKIGRAMAKITFKYSSEIIVQNEYQNINIKKYFSVNPITIKSGYPLPNKIIKVKKNNILWVARSKEWKRPEIFISLAKKLPKYDFVMICPSATGSNSYFATIKNDAKKISNLKFIDFVPFNKIQNFFNSANIFINTSTNEGFANTFIQSAIAGTPIISLSVNPNNFITKNDCGFYCDKNTKLLTKYVELLMSDEQLHYKKSKNIFNYAKQNHDIKINVYKFLKILKCAE